MLLPNEEVCPGCMPTPTTDHMTLKHLKEREKQLIDAFVEGYVFSELPTELEDKMVAFNKESAKLLLEEVKLAAEGMKRKHWVFECDGPRPNKTTKHEDFCGDPECRSDDNKAVIAHNNTLSDLISHLTNITEELK